MTLKEYLPLAEILVSELIGQIDLGDASLKEAEDEVASITAHAGCGSLKTHGWIITFHNGMITGTDKLLPQVLGAEASKHLGMNAPCDNHLESVR